jgi:hypothetical protein
VDRPALRARVPRVELAATGGVHDGQDRVKMLLAGAQVAMVCSALFKHKEQHLAHMLAEMEAWMRAKEYAAVDDFRGVLSHQKNPEPQAYERSHYIKMLVGSTEKPRRARRRRAHPTLLPPTAAPGPPAPGRPAASLQEGPSGGSS